MPSQRSVVPLDGPNASAPKRCVGGALACGLGTAESGRVARALSDRDCALTTVDDASTERRSVNGERSIEGSSRDGVEASERRALGVARDDVESTADPGVDLLDGAARAMKCGFMVSEELKLPAARDGAAARIAHWADVPTKGDRMPEEQRASMTSAWDRRKGLTEAPEGLRAPFPGPQPLRDVLDFYVAERRTDGAPPERVLLEVKDLLKHLGLPRRLEDGPAPAGRGSIVKWTLESYFRPRD